MPDTERQRLARCAFEAYAESDRQKIEELLSDDFEFFAPPDPGIDRARYFERCWPNAGQLASFDIVRLVESGDEVIVTYEAERSDGTRFRNTEVLAFRGRQMVRTEVYFGWNLD